MKIEDILKEVVKTENAIIINGHTLASDTLQKYDQLISIETEISLEEGLVDINLFVVIDEPIGVSLPKIYLDTETYDRIKYIPHINEDLSICVYDENENYRINAENLPQIVVDLISEAKRILRKKDNSKYCQQEFEREFFAYWAISSSSKTEVRDLGLCLIDFDSFENLKAIRFEEKLAHYKYLVYNKEDDFKQLQKYLNFRNVKFTDIEVFKVDFEDYTPPYNYSYQESISFLKKNESFRKKINKLNLGDFLIVFKGSANELYGWTYPELKNRIKGFRGFSNWQFLNSSLGKNKKIRRLSFSNISSDRLDKRTSGNVIERNIKISLIGLGSVGSNLLNYILKFPVSEYLLVDPDVLKIENVFRHNYGFNYLSNYKTIISKNNILSKNPFTVVQTEEQDICKVLNKNSEALESFHFRMIIVGLSRIEVFILEHLIKINSTKPVLIIWVEPFLASGQLLFLQPNDFQKGVELIKDYPYHILEKDQYFLMKEGSCQSGFYPYSEANLNLFLSSINYFLYELIVMKKEKTSKIFTWIGDLNFLKERQIKYKSEYEGRIFELIENNVN